jgi:hypothetical protein
MTGSTRPTIPQVVPIQVAENDGMPSRPNFEPPQTPAARTRRLTGTLTLGLSKTRVANGRLRSAKKEPMRHEQKSTRHLMARLIAQLSAAAGIIACLTFPVFAQDGTGPFPENAVERSYGDGWVCELGYRVEGAECLALDIPELAYPTGRSYGTGWSCERGYEPLSGACVAIDLPFNAYLDRSGNRWSCNRSFNPSDGACILG